MSTSNSAMFSSYTPSKLMSYHPLSESMGVKGLKAKLRKEIIYSILQNVKSV